MPRTVITNKGQTLVVVKVMGTGAFGTASAVKKRDGTMLCLKEVNVRNADAKTKESVLQEVQLMKETCNHPNIVHLCGSWVDHRCMYILMELCVNALDKVIEEHSLAKKRFTAGKVKQWLEDLTDAVRYLHDVLKIMHRDIKPANILLDSLGTLKLADFGLGKKLGVDGLALTYVGTPLYMSPEQCTGHSYTKAADVWALGVVFYELMSGHTPWETSGQCLRNIRELIQCIRDSTPDYEPLKALYPSDLIKTTRWMLQKTVSKRATAAQIVALVSMRAPPDLGLSILPGMLPAGVSTGTEEEEEAAPSPAAPSPAAPLLSETAKTLPEEIVADDVTTTLDRRAALLADAARFIQRDFRASIEKRRTRQQELQSPVEYKPLYPMDRHRCPPLPTQQQVNEQVAEKASMIQKAVRMSLNPQAETHRSPYPQAGSAPFEAVGAQPRPHEPARHPLAGLRDQGGAQPGRRSRRPAPRRGASYHSHPTASCAAGTDPPSRGVGLRERERESMPYTARRESAPASPPAFSSTV